MISRLAIPPGDVSAAALLLVVGPGLRGLEIEAAINLQPVRLLVNDRKFPAGNSVFLSHQTSQQ